MWKGTMVDGKTDEHKMGIVQVHDAKINGNVVGALYEIDMFVEWMSIDYLNWIENIMGKSDECY